MYKKINNLLLLIILAVVIMLTGYIGSAIAGGPGPSANGHGNLLLDYELRTFSFHAREFKDGSVEGSFELKNREQGVRIHAEIDCLLIDDIDDHIATMSGVITQVRGDDVIMLNDIVWFRVKDNGEGSVNYPDEITLVLVEINPEPELEILCDGTPAINNPLKEIIAGNIQVKP